MKGHVISIEPVAVAVSRDEERDKPVVVEVTGVAVDDEEEEIELSHPTYRPQVFNNYGGYQNVQIQEHETPLSVLDRAFCVVCLLSLVEIAIGITSSVYIGASFQIACIAFSFFKFVALLPKASGWQRGSIVTALSCLDLIFAALFFHTVFGIASCIKYPFSTNLNTPDFTGDQAYYQQTLNCAQSSSQLFWNCYCYNEVTDKCITVDATSNAESNSAAVACGDIIDQTPSLAIALLVLSVVQLAAFLMITILAKRNERLAN